jgi:nitrate reductase assembly molybdenum cofactor insertion protein NarJ
MIDSTFFIHLFRFYSKCMAAPYNELAFELQHIFRQMEVSSQNELDEQLAAHCLEVLNYFQGEEVSSLQAEYSRMFSHPEDKEPLISICFTDYGNPEEAQKIMDDIYDTMLEVSYDESPDSLINFLDYFSYLSETGEVVDALGQFVMIMLPFSQQFYKAANINFYKELAKGLNELSVIFNDYFEN